MTDATQKISELPEIVYPNENFSVPIATNQNASSAETFKTTLNEIRSVLLFENAFSTIADGMAGTAKGDKFYVYTDATKYFVSGWLNAGNSATALVDNNAVQLTWGTIYSIKKGSGPVVAQWIYNGGYAKGGETTLTPVIPSGLAVAEVYVNGDRQFKDQGFTVTNNTTITLASELEVNDLVVVIMSSSDVTLEDLNNTLLALFSGSTGAGQIGVTGGGTVQSVLDNFGVVLPSVQTLLTGVGQSDTIQVRGFYSENDGGEGVWISTGNLDGTKAGTHVPASALIYDSTGKEYQLNVKSGDSVNALSNGLKAVISFNNIADQTEDFICVGEVVNGITSLVKTMSNAVDMTTYLKVTIPALYPLRLGKKSVKLYSRLVLDFQQTSIYVRPSPSNFQTVTGVWMNALERGIEDVKAISSMFNGATSYGNMTLSDFHLLGGKFYGDHNTTSSYKDSSSGTGLLTYNMENSTIENTWFQEFAVGRQYVRTSSGYYYDNLGNKILGTLIPEVATSSTGSYEGVHEIDVSSYGCRFLHLRTVSNWGKFDKCKFGTYADWSSSPDGNLFNYFIENSGAGVVFTSGVIESNTIAANPLKGFVLDRARGVSFIGVYYENPLVAGWVIAIPDKSQYNRGNGLFLTTLGSYYIPNSKGTPIIAFEEGYFGEYDPATGLYATGGWETNYQYIGGVNTWSVGQPTPDLGAFPHGGYDFKYGTYGIHYQGPVPDVDSVRDTLEGNEFLSPYGLQVNSGNLLLPISSPAYQSNIVVWYKDLTGNFDPRNVVVGDFDNLNTSDGSNNAVFRTNGVNHFDFGNGYKALIVPYVNPRAADSRMNTSAGDKLKIVVTSSTPIILKSVQAFVGGTPIFPTKIPDYLPKSQGDRIWGTMSSSTTDASPYYSNKIGGGIFKPGDVISPFNPYNNTALKSPGTYSDMSSTYGNNFETRMITGGTSFGPGYGKVTFLLSVTSVDTVNNWTTVSVPSESAAFIFLGMVLNITANSSGGSTGLINLVRRVKNSDGTLSNSYVLEGNLGSSGTTLTVSTDISYNYLTGTSTSLNGTTQYFTVSKWFSTLSGDLRNGYGGSTGTKLLRFYYDGNNVSGIIGSETSNGIFLSAGGGFTLNSNLISSTKYSFGTSSAYPSNIYSQNAVTVVSDENLKDDIQELSDEEIACAIACGKLYRRYKLKTAIAEKGEDGARYHVGTIAQYIVQCFTDNNLDWTKYGIITYEKWEATEAVVDENGDIVTPAKSGGEIYMVRYDELNSFINAGQQSRLDKLETLMNYGS